MIQCSFTVYGTPKPQGSMRAFMRPGMKHPVLTTDNKKLKPWRQEVTGAALAQNFQQLEGPVSITLDFHFTRPKSAKKRNGMTVKPDIDKLQRSIFDSLTGVLFRDDAQIVRVVARKHYSDPERVEIQVREEEEDA